MVLRVVQTLNWMLIVAAAPSLNLTAEEKRVYGLYFSQADTDKIGVVTGEVAVKFFERTRLDARVLGEVRAHYKAQARHLFSLSTGRLLTPSRQIWQIADKENRGLLTPAGFGIVLRLIGHYQAGREPTPELAFQPGPLPKFDGGIPGGPIQPQLSATPAQLQPQTSGGAIRVPPLTADKVAQYSGLFEKSEPQNGVLPGDKAKQIFERANLPNDVLGRIWNLADTEQRGALVLTEFIIAMHLLASYKAGAMRALPNVLPAALYEAAARRPPPRQLSSSSPSPIAAIPRQFSGQPGRVSSPLARSSFAAPPIVQQSTGQSGDWAITPADKQRFDQIYASLDKTNKGYITGEEAVPFFSNSKLPEEALAQIWDLADINSQGILSRDEFAVAMYLIRQQRSKEQGRGSLPATLPANLIPPSMRNQVRAPAQPTAPAFEQPAAPMPKSAADDLFGLDALSASPTSAAQTQVPLSTGGSTSYNDPFSSKSPAAMTPTSPAQGSPQMPTQFKPFVPSSSFGRSLDYQPTGGSTAGAVPAARSIQPQTTGMDDLLGDNDPEQSKKLTNESAELANLSNQVSSLSTQMQNVQGDRATVQEEFNQASAQKREFEVRLAQLRTLYEKEVKDVNGLKERLNMSRNETTKIKQEIAMIEGTHGDLQTQKAQITAALQGDQQENATLKEKMRVLSAEIQQFKPQLEKLKSDARQQKGLVAINKKQLATLEAEQERLRVEAEEAKKSIEEDNKTIAAQEEHQRSLTAAAAAVPIHSPAVVASPAPSSMSANNPFFRGQGSTSEAVFSPFSPASQSPAPAHDTERSFDDVFGTGFGSGSAAKAAMPPTTFRSEVDATHEIPVAAASTALPITESVSGSRVASPAPAAALAPPYTGNSTRDISGASIPPAVPASRQISSSFLPFSRSAVADSVSSSRQVSAPNSRFGTDGADGEDSAGAETPTNYSGLTPAGSSAGHQESVPAVSEPHHQDSTDSTIPGAFPGDDNSAIAATPTGESLQSENAQAVNKTGPVDPFSFDSSDHKVSAASKDDFDSAFASFGSSSKAEQRESSPQNASIAGGSSQVNQEFPPLQQLDDEDDSDSDDGGFEDDFTGAGGHSRNQSEAVSQPAILATAAPSGGLLAPRPVPVSQISAASSVGVNPPAEDAQQSPPAYNAATTQQDRSHAEVDAYAGLLPTREDSTTISPTSGSAAAAAGPSSFPGSSATSTAATATPAPPAKVPFDEFDDEFDDLEDAKEGGDDDDFADLSVTNHSLADSFDPTFDSPTATTSMHTATGSGFGGSSYGINDFTASPTRTTAPVFMSSSAGPNTTTAALAGAVPATAAKTTSDSHDWDAIFAGLDNGPAADDLTITSAPGAAKSNGTTDYAPPSGPPPLSTTGAQGSSNSASRPLVGRALTEAGIHDDPILKELTEMGYARKDALSALEKYDYNLERVSLNQLCSHD